jgi:hypothetical protein
MLALSQSVPLAPRFAAEAAIVRIDGRGVFIPAPAGAQKILAHFA